MITQLLITLLLVSWSTGTVNACLCQASPRWDQCPASDWIGLAAFTGMVASIATSLIYMIWWW